MMVIWNHLIKKVKIDRKFRQSKKNSNRNGLAITS